ncbi:MULTISPECIES: amidohydrolase family protein [Pseudonocardia]|uniref:8-oxoguanine deaminase n=2 Tax=Pseudonocardia TaxID=1847 RepID=A0A1Y2N248_PSEAH|nr:MULTISPECIES: amidohydrolase family protein [Pseudonocardia]OSY41545.1 8-oxoguanine deaminase [Pseudonocardia autotrophica]TDN71500.1 guanine deaminase [Pseudonocardia autotrophica]BBG02179.1 5-methylthioadenosine/S-adenosylhomocysteine deaminase [Pseudonocardia autotrophica]GEC24193.1 5-methylthioadenosine/S-adenosylhomocysteine deaminase [Pseudonocardia saturnea]
MALVIRDAEVLTMDAVTGATPVRRSIRIDGDTITEVGTRVRTDDTDTVLDGRDRLVCPGFVNAHTHSWEYLAKGRYDNLPLELWMLYSYPILGARPLSPDLIRLRSLLFAAESLKSGVTTLVDDVLETPAQDLDQLDAVVGAYDRIGIRADVSGHVINRPFVDTVPYAADRLPPAVVSTVRSRPVPTAQEYLDFSAEALRRYRDRAGGRVRYMLAPSGPQRCTDDLITGAAELAPAHDVSCHIHVLETKVQAVTGREFHGSTLVEHLRRIGALTPNTTLAHGIWVTDADIDLLAEHGSGVAHNPVSNLKLGSGIAPWRRYHRAGVTLGLGTDGCSSSDTPRMHDVLKAAALLHKVTGPDHHDWPRADEVLRAATAGGARTAHRHHEIGTIAPGMQADLLLYDLDTLAFTPRNRAELQLVHSENGSSLRRVLVAGRTVVEDGRLTTVDEDALRAELAELMPGIRAEQDRLERENDVFADAFEWMHRTCAGEDVGVHRWSGPDPSLARSH